MCGRSLFRFSLPAKGNTGAYAVVLAIPVIIDFAFDTNIEMLVIVWLNIGMLVMRTKGMTFPTPDSRRIDVAGGLRLM